MRMVMDQGLSLAQGSTRDDKVDKSQHATDSKRMWGWLNKLARNAIASTTLPGGEPG